MVVHGGAGGLRTSGRQAGRGPGCKVAGKALGTGLGRSGPVLWVGADREQGDVVLGPGGQLKDQRVAQLLQRQVREPPGGLLQQS